MHHAKVSTNYADLPHNLDPKIPTPKQYRDMKIQPLGNRQKVYDDFIASCKAAYPKVARRCSDTESDRVEMSLRQPQSMQNYTELGFTKLKTPEKLFTMLKEFWEKNQDKAKQEQWGDANT
jgi:prolyl 4-hydroxylase